MAISLRPQRWLWLCLLLALLPLGCGQQPEPKAAARLIVLGFDGLDPKLVERWMADGSLPEFDRLRREGHYQTLATSNPPQSPVAWASFATGEGAGAHGIFDFLRRNPETYAPEFSIAQFTPPAHSLSFGNWDLPLGDGRLVNRRQGEPFWLRATAQGQRATVQRVPVTYPPDPVQRMLAGMGVPDLRGSQGTYTLYATRAMAAAESGGRVVNVAMSNQGRIETLFEGPQHPLKPMQALSLPLIVDARADSAAVTLGDETRELKLGVWSDWWPLRFPFTLGSIPGMVRLRLVEGYPRPLLYVSPVHADPTDVVVPLTSPPQYAAELAERIGRFHTLGMPEETWSLNQGHLDEQGFIDMVRTTLAEGEAMLFDAMDRHDSELVIHVFVQPDRISHMFWRGLDAQHPLHAESNDTARGAIGWIYREADRVLGAVRARMGPDDRLVVLSDHGFASFRRAVHVNRWLVERGYLVLTEGAKESEPLFAQVDWSRSRAYALGLNGIFINQAGRERSGIVTADERAALLQEIIKGLADWRDADGSVIVQQSFLASAIYPGAHAEDAPDLVLGYAPGYRASWQTTLGGAPRLMVEDNRQPWSGDHCIDPAAVPGVLFTSFEPGQSLDNIAAMADFLLKHTPAAPAH
jgi:predicted AlkP superfamily phosphohydrolase/phosphomutase